MPEEDLVLSDAEVASLFRPVAPAASRLRSGRLIERKIAPPMVDGKHRGSTIDFSEQIDPLPDEVLNNQTRQLAHNLTQLLQYSKNGKLYFKRVGGVIAFWVDIEEVPVVDDVVTVLREAVTSNIRPNT